MTYRPSASTDNSGAFLYADGRRWVRHGRVERASCWAAKSRSATATPGPSSNLRQDRAPGVDDRRVAICVEFTGQFAHLPGGDDEDLVLDRTRPYENLPVETACCGCERRRHHDHQRAGEGEYPVQLREPAGRSRSSTRPGQGSSSDGVMEAIVARLPGSDGIRLAADSSRHVDIEEMDLAVAGGKCTVGAHETSRVVPAPGRELDEASCNEPDAVFLRDRRWPIASRYRGEVQQSCEEPKHCRRPRSAPVPRRALLPATRRGPRGRPLARGSPRDHESQCTVRLPLAWVTETLAAVGAGLAPRRRNRHHRYRLRPG